MEITSHCEAFTGHYDSDMSCAEGVRRGGVENVSIAAPPIGVNVN